MIISGLLAVDTVHVCPLGQLGGLCRARLSKTRFIHLKASIREPHTIPDLHRIIDGASSERDVQLVTHPPADTRNAASNLEVSVRSEVISSDPLKLAPGGGIV